MSDANAKHPIVGVGAVVRRGDSVWLVQRGGPPLAGGWGIPGGRVEWGEPLARAAEREILEETGVVIEAGRVVFSFEHIEPQDGGVLEHFVVLDLEGRYVSGEPCAGDDARAAAWVRIAELDRWPVSRITRAALAELFPGEMP